MRVVKLASFEQKEEKRLNPLDPSAQRVQEILWRFGPEFIVIEFSDSTRTAQEAAERLNCHLGQIVKSLVFKTKASNKGVLVLTSGANRVDETKISHYIGEPLIRADADFVHTVTGFAIGGVPPIGHSQPMETFIDEDLMQYPVVWAAAGTPNAVFKLSSSDLGKITRGKVIPVKKE